MDGAVYEWNVYTGKRDGESVLKSCSYTGVAVSPDGRTTYAVGSDKTLKEICDSQVRNYQYHICSWLFSSLTGSQQTVYCAHLFCDASANNLWILQILREVSSSDMVLTQVSMSRSGRMLFVGTNTGTVRAMKFPLTVPGEWQEHQAHGGAITKVQLNNIACI